MDVRVSYSVRTSQAGRKPKARHAFRFEALLSDTKPTSLTVRAYLEAVALAERFCLDSFGRQVGKRVKNWELLGDTFFIAADTDAFAFKMRWM